MGRNIKSDGEGNLLIILFFWKTLGPGIQWGVDTQHLHKH